MFLQTYARSSEIFIPKSDTLVFKPFSFIQSTVASQTSLLITERIIYVNEHFSRTLHHSICRALFNTDRQLFTVLLAFATLRSKVKRTKSCLLISMSQSRTYKSYRAMSSRKRLIGCTQKLRCLQVTGSVHLGSTPRHGNILWI